MTLGEAPVQTQASQKPHPEHPAVTPGGGTGAAAGQASELRSSAGARATPLASARATPLAAARLPGPHPRSRLACSTQLRSQEMHDLGSKVGGAFLPGESLPPEA